MKKGNVFHYMYSTCMCLLPSRACKTLHMKIWETVSNVREFYEDFWQRIWETISNLGYQFPIFTFAENGLPLLKKEYDRRIPHETLPLSTVYFNSLLTFV